MAEYALQARVGEPVEFVNGGYAIDRLATLHVRGRDILYGAATACLDNSCCGQMTVCYPIIFGERVGADADGHPLVRTVDDPAEAEAIQRELQQRLGAQTAVWSPSLG